MFAKRVIASPICKTRETSREAREWRRLQQMIDTMRAAVQQLADLNEDIRQEIAQIRFAHPTDRLLEESVEAVANLRISR